MLTIPLENEHIILSQTSIQLYLLITFVGCLGHAGDIYVVTGCPEGYMTKENASTNQNLLFVNAILSQIQALRCLRTINS